MQLVSYLSLLIIHEETSFGSHALRPTSDGGRIKVTDQLIWINVLPPDGVPRRYSAFSGESLLEVLDRNVTAGIHSDCAGGDNEHTFRPHQVPFDYYSMGASCGQCQVILSDPYFDKANKTNSVEERTLERGAHRSTADNSRLACCV